jgi:hypothetical protein
VTPSLRFTILLGWKGTDDCLIQAYSPVVPCMIYFMDLVPKEKNMQILAASE